MPFAVAKEVASSVTDCVKLRCLATSYIVLHSMTQRNVITQRNVHENSMLCAPTDATCG